MSTKTIKSCSLVLQPKGDSIYENKIWRMETGKCIENCLLNFVSSMWISLLVTATAVRFEQDGWCLDVTNQPLKTMFLFQFWPIYQAATHQALALMSPLTVIIIRPSDKMRPVQNTKRLMSWAEITFDLYSIRYLELEIGIVEHSQLA